MNAEHHKGVAEPHYGPPPPQYDAQQQQQQYGWQQQQQQYAAPPPQQQQQYAAPPPPQQQQQPQVNVMTVPALSLGMDPANIRCPNCHQQVLTEVKRSNTSKTHLWFFGLCICGCWLCCCIPYCCNACRGAMHSCPNCKVDLGVGTS